MNLKVGPSACALDDNSKSVEMPARHLLPPPAAPLSWLWQCHRCNNVYSLTVTRRCLEDGHYFCTGTDPVRQGRPKSRSAKKGQLRACKSEFDYHGWKAWGAWRRELSRVPASELHSELHEQAEAWRVPDSAEATDLMLTPTTLHKRDCWNQCDYPSECRWRMENSSSFQPSEPITKEEFSTPSHCADETPTFERQVVEEKRKVLTSFEEILTTIPEHMDDADIWETLPELERSPSSSSSSDEMEEEVVIEEDLSGHNGSQRYKRSSSRPIGLGIKVGGALKDFLSGMKDKGI